MALKYPTSNLSKNPSSSLSFITEVIKHSIRRFRRTLIDYSIFRPLQSIAISFSDGPFARMHWSISPAWATAFGSLAQSAAARMYHQVTYYFVSQKLNPTPTVGAMLDVHYREPHSVDPTNAIAATLVLSVILILSAACCVFLLFDNIKLGQPTLQSRVIAVNPAENSQTGPTSEGKTDVHSDTNAQANKGTMPINPQTQISSNITDAKVAPPQTADQSTRPIFHSKSSSASADHAPFMATSVKATSTITLPANAASSDNSSASTLSASIALLDSPHTSTSRFYTSATRILSAIPSSVDSPPATTPFFDPSSTNTPANNTTTIDAVSSEALVDSHIKKMISSIEAASEANFAK